MSANQIENRLHAMALISGPVPDGGAFNPAYPNGVVMNCVGVKGFYRVTVGQYYLQLEEPIEFLAIPPGAPTGTRPPFTRGLVESIDYGSAASGVNNRINSTIVPTDIPPVLMPDGQDMRGSVFVSVRHNIDNTYVDTFLGQILVWGFPNDGASGAEGEWPAIAGKPAS